MTDYGNTDLAYLEFIIKIPLSWCELVSMLKSEIIRLFKYEILFRVLFFNIDIVRDEGKMHFHNRLEFAIKSSFSPRACAPAVWNSYPKFHHFLPQNLNFPFFIYKYLTNFNSLYLHFLGKRYLIKHNSFLVSSI